MRSRLSKILNDDNRISAFDFIRSISVFSIILTHFEIMDIKGVGVDAFFVLSGFLISKILSGKTPDVNKHYFVSRSTKILPSYFFFLVLAFSFGYFIWADIFGENLPKIDEWKQYVFFYRNYGGLPNRWAFEHLWALCVEEQFYVIIFLFSLTCSSRKVFIKWLPSFGITLVLVGIIAKSQALLTDFAEYPTYTHNRLDAFGYGILIFAFYHKLENIRWLKRPVSIFSLVLLLSLFVLSDSSKHALVLRLFAPPLLGLIILSIIDISFPKVFRVVAYYSYNAYLWHYFILIPIVYYFGFGMIGLLVYLLSTCALAIVSTHLVEDYFINRRKLIFDFLFNRRNRIYETKY